MPHLGKIKAIERVYDLPITDEGRKFPTEYEGYRVVTNKNVFLVLIGTERSCCEYYGRIQSEDDLEYFVGKELIGVNLTDTALLTMEVAMTNEPLKIDREYDEGGIQFVTFLTRAGAFQLAVYNVHNGYYGHQIKILQNDTVLLDDHL